jgi:hypothetical protein
VLDAAAAVLEDRTDYLRVLAAHATEMARLEEASLEPPMGLDSLLMHGRRGTMGGSSRPGDGGAAAATMANAGMR